MPIRSRPRHPCDKQGVASAAHFIDAEMRTSGTRDVHDHHGVSIAAPFGGIRRIRGFDEAANRLDEQRALCSERPPSVANAPPFSFNATARFAFCRSGSRDVAPTVRSRAPLDGSHPTSTSSLSVQAFSWLR